MQKTIDKRISIITPSFNQGQYIEQTIDSVLSQNYPNLEYIIIDGGSTDNTVEIIKKYEKYLKYWVSEKDRGQSHAINKGLKYATGDIINWINSDDYLEPEALTKINRFFQNEDVDVLCGFANILRSDADVAIKKRTSKKEESVAKIISTGHIMQPATFFRKEIFEEITPVEETLHYMMDHYLWLKYICSYGFDRVKYIDDTIVNVTLHEEAKSVQQLKYFKKDRERIYYSLFKNSHKKSKCYNNIKTIPLEFPKRNMLVFENFEEIDFFLLRNNLFEYDSSGARGRMNYKRLIKLLLYYPFRFIKDVLF